MYHEIGKRITRSEFEDYKRQKEDHVRDNVRETEVRFEKTLKLIEEKILYKVEEVSSSLSTF